jgi:hypothetical protein
MSIYDTIMKDKGSAKAGTLNLPLSDFLRSEEEDESDEKKFLSSGIISFNLLSTGTVNKSLIMGGQILISSPSKFGKSLLVLAHYKDAQKKGMEIVHINSEGKGAFNFKTAKAFGINTDPKVFNVLETNSIEECETIIAKIVEGKTKEERKMICFGIDSFSGLISTKATMNALDGKTLTVDMTDSRLRNKLSSILNSSGMTRVIVVHAYANTGGFGERLSVGGASRIYFMSDSCVLFSERSKEKDKKTKEVLSFIITGHTHKSRYSRENSALDVQITPKGLNCFYGLLPDALEGGFVLKDNGKCYRDCIKDDEPVDEDKIYNKEFWTPIFQKTDFKKYLEKKYKFDNDLEISKIDVEDMFTEEKISEESEVITEPSETPKKKKGKK